MFFSEKQVKEAKDHTKSRSGEHLVWQRQLLTELWLEGGKSDAFSCSQSKACQGINIRPISGVPVSSEQVIRSLQVWVVCFSNLVVLSYHSSPFQFPLSVLPTLPSFSFTLSNTPPPFTHPLSHTAHKVKLKTCSLI